MNFFEGRLEKILFAAIFFHIILGVFFSRISPTYFEGDYVREAGLIEMLTFDALVLGFAICIFRVCTLYNKRNYSFIFGTLVLAVIFLFGAGEEISWGQRILGFKSSSFFQIHNSQGEVNFHNLIFKGKKINKVIFGTSLGILVAIYFLILPYCYRRIGRVKKFIDGHGIPVPKILHILSYLVLVGLAFFITSGKKGEILEFGGVWIFIMVLLYPHNRRAFS